MEPELRFAEYRTSEILTIRLADAGFAVRRGLAGTGAIASLSGGETARHVMLRADLDALPIPDEKDVIYRSRRPGVSHACGHDVHMAVVVTAAEVLAQRGFSGRLDVLLQPAEEVPFGERSGARAILEAEPDLLTGVDAVIGLHSWPSLPVGTIGLDRRFAMAAKDAFRLEVRGAAGHAAAPQTGRDALLASAHIVSLLHQVIARRVKPSEQVALNVGTIAGGRSQSIVPDRVVMTGTIRSIAPSVRSEVKSEVMRIAEGVAMATGTSARIEWANEMPPVVNAPELVELAMDVLLDLPGVRVSSEEPIPMTTDDFAIYSELVPSLYFKLGTTGVDAASDEFSPSLHSSTFDVDEAAIGVGISAVTALVEGLLGESSGTSTNPRNTRGQEAGS
jgi:amidohydrolase